MKEAWKGHPVFLFFFENYFLVTAREMNIQANSFAEEHALFYRRLKSPSQQKVLGHKKSLGGWAKAYKFLSLK